MLNKFITVLVCILSAVSLADTFINPQSGEKFTGYARFDPDNYLSEVVTPEKGTIEVNLQDFKVIPDYNGRNDYVSVISIKDVIEYQMSVEGFTEALVQEANRGPKFIIIEIDCPGGVVPYVQEMCDQIVALNTCQVVAYVSGGECGGAYSGGAAIAIACDKIMMRGGTVMGAASLIALNSQGSLARLSSNEEALYEKASSAWSSYLAALATNNNRSGTLAKAMADTDIIAVEVKRNNKNIVVEKANVQPGDKVIKIWSDYDKLLTLTANDALKCNMADHLCETRLDILECMKVECKTIKENNDFEQSIRAFENMVSKRETIIAKVSNSSSYRSRSYNQNDKNSLTQTVRRMKKEIGELEWLIRVQKKYPELEQIAPKGRNPFRESNPYTNSRLEANLDQLKQKYNEAKAALRTMQNPNNMDNNNNNNNRNRTRRY